MISNPPAPASGIQLASNTSLQIGGPADYFAEVSSQVDLAAAWCFAQERQIPTFFLGEGTNVLFADDGFRGLVIRNSFTGRSRSGREIWVGAGENLPALIRWTNEQGLAGLERMYGIPGSVAGAIVGNAGAYGQEISDVLKKVTVWSDGELSELDVADLDLGYRHSRLKEERDKFLISCILQLNYSPKDLQSESDDILRKREKKYPVGLRCPGSFFKNVVFEEVDPAIRRRIPREFVMFGKIPAGKLLEAVGANGSRIGDAAIAGYHGNLLLNRGEARARDILDLAQKYADRVYEEFGLLLEPEIRVAPGLNFACPEERKKVDARRDTAIQN